MLGEKIRELPKEDMDVGDLSCCSGSTRNRVLRIGCALLPKKVSRYLTKSMERIASNRGVQLVLLDHTKPLIDQGEYDAIVHKLRPNKEWERNLQEYITARPGVKVIDSLAGIRIVHNRATMLLPLREDPNGITLQRPYTRNVRGRGAYGIARIQSPTQVEITEGMSLAEAQTQLHQAGLTPPLLVKPLWTDGREGSHGLAVLHDMAAMGKVLHGDVSSSLKPPLVVQQFVDHGGVLFKVYVLGARTVVCLRPSLGDSQFGQEARREGVQSLPRISCKSSYPKGSPEDKLSTGIVYYTGSRVSEHPTEEEDGGGAEMRPWRRDQVVSAPDITLPPEHLMHPAAPPDWVTSALAGTLRDKLGLQLFNFDMICPAEQPSPHERLYYVVDINYFPGVDKIPDFERIFVEFLTATCDGESEDANDHDAPADSALADTDMANGGEDGVSSVSSDKGDFGQLSGVDAPAPAAEALGATWGTYERLSSDLR
ncbi:hypothetical protein Vretimale_13982 [Volvox reticuliferus]|uniref:Uncharacterized protein n=1 Tax=Volvox reticuliferus TaxID=1737510 RepID=A0A8J4CR55_9CHLO|nr:hypothetical protein Vretifemale_16217 [Volvox reticuliferus]GIM10424.1 hypothetical protein Vretimale_13982 [Volvox reticuliferus]